MKYIKQTPFILNKKSLCEEHTNLTRCPSQGSCNINYVGACRIEEGKGLYWKGTSVQMFAYTKSTRFSSGHLATQRCRNFEIIGVLCPKQVIKNTCSCMSSKEY